MVGQLVVYRLAWYTQVSLKHSEMCIHSYCHHHCHYYHLPLSLPLTPQIVKIIIVTIIITYHHCSYHDHVCLLHHHEQCYNGTSNPFQGL